MTVKRALILLIISLTLTNTLFGQSLSDSILDSYVFKKKGTEMNLILFTDSSYSFEITEKYGTIISSGKWTRTNEILCFYNFKPSYLVDTVEESFIDTVNHEIIIDVFMRDSTPIVMRGCRDVLLYIDERPINVLINPFLEHYFIYDFPVWINRNYLTIEFTNNRGRVVFKVDSIDFVSGDFFDFKIENKETNYIQIYLEKYPDITSSKYLKLDQWVISKKHITTYKDNEMEVEVKLKKK